jgi:hypothetical protein
MHSPGSQGDTAMDIVLIVAAGLVALVLMDLLALGHGAETRDGFTR